MKTIEEQVRRKALNRDSELSLPDEDVESGEIEGSPAGGNLKYLLAGIFFGILLIKSEVVSWFRIQEMFRLQSFHMYGIMGMAVLVGVVSTFLLKKWKIKTFNNQPISFPKKKFSVGQVYGGLLFGFGWALTGACPGPVYALVGNGATVFLITLLSAVAGTWTYGLIRRKLPH